MARTVSRLFNNHEDATQAVADLEAAGFAHDDIALVSGDPARTSGARSFAPSRTHDPSHPDNVHAGHGVTKGAAIGGALGGGAGLVAGLGLLAIPGMGPVLAAGFLASAVAGAATGAMTGGMLGALRDSGVSEEDAHTLAEGVRRGGAIVSIRAADERASQAEGILVRHGGVEAAVRRPDYEAEGWTGFQQDARDRPAADPLRNNPSI